MSERILQIPESVINKKISALQKLDTKKYNYFGTDGNCRNIQSEIELLDWVKDNCKDTK